MATTSTPTLAELSQQLLEAPDDGRRYEIVHNQLVAMPPAERNAAVVTAWLTSLLGQVVAADRLGSLTSAEGAYTLSGPPDANIRAPDIGFVRSGRVPSRSRRGPFPQLAPDLVPC
jgi:Uma2 family endonuclease